MMTMCSIVTVSCYSYSIQISYIILYKINVSYLTAGPIVEPTMRISMLSSRDTTSNIEFTLSFNVSFGSPSSVFCRYESTSILNRKREHPKLSREVIRSQYVNSSQPDMTRVTVKEVQAIRKEGMYACQVFVEGRVNIVSGTYEPNTKGDGVTEVNVTGE